MEWYGYGMYVMYVRMYVCTRVCVHVCKNGCVSLCVWGRVGDYKGKSRCAKQQSELWSETSQGTQVGAHASKFSVRGRSIAHSMPSFTGQGPKHNVMRQVCAVMVLTSCLLSELSCGGTKTKAREEGS